MNGVIGFKNHKICCVIGVYPEERTEKQDIFVDLKVETTIGEYDNLASTIDYVALVDLCTHLAEKNQYQLLETFTAEALKRILDQFPVSWAWMRVKKPGGLPSGDYSFVEMRVP